MLVEHTEIKTCTQRKEKREFQHVVFINSYLVIDIGYFDFRIVELILKANKKQNSLDFSKYFLLIDRFLLVY